MTDKEKILRICESLNIKSIICVDDNYSDSPDDSTLIALFESLPVEKIKKINKLKSLAEIPDLEIRTEKFKEIWKESNEEDRRELNSAIMSVENDEEIESSIHSKLLKDLFSDFDFKEYSPQQWKKEKKSIIESANSNNKIIIFFDMDLSHGGESSIGGILNISDLQNEENIICGLITHKIDVNNEVSEWENISEEHNIKKDRFLLISKDRLQDDSLNDFVKMFQLNALTPLSRILKENSKDILIDSHDEAYKRLMDINVYDFDYLICHSARREGIWEPELLFRLYNSFHKKEAYKTAYSDPDLQNISNSIREISQVSPLLEPTPENVFNIQKEELYKNAEYLNQNLLPVELGDIFRLTIKSNTRFYILLNQPCDLMIRSNGTRSRDFNDALLIEITDKPNQNDPFCTPELLCWGENANEKYYVNFRSRVNTRLCILDLCTFDFGGASIFDTVKEAPSTVIPSRAKYYKKNLKKQMNKIKLLFETIEENEQKSIDTVSPLFMKPFSVQVNQNFIKFNCERVKRYLHERSAELLTKYSFFMSRAAFDRNWLDDLPGNDDPRDKELFELKKQIKDLKEENESLKKAAAISSEGIS